SLAIAVRHHWETAAEQRRGVRYRQATGLVHHGDVDRTAALRHQREIERRGLIRSNRDAGWSLDAPVVWRWIERDVVGGGNVVEDQQRTTAEATIRGSRIVDAEDHRARERNPRRGYRACRRHVVGIGGANGDRAGDEPEILGAHGEVRRRKRPARS